MSDTTRYPDEILRDYVKGRLPAAEAAAIEADAKADPALAAEIALVRGIVKSSDAKYCRAPPAELGWGMLSRRIEDEASRSRSLMPRQFSRWQVAAVAAIAVMGSLVAGSFLPRGLEQGERFETASRPPARAWSAQATFVPTAPEGAIREALRSVNAEIVQGPSALGVYVLSFRDADALARGVAALRARADIFESVNAS